MIYVFTNNTNTFNLTVRKSGFFDSSGGLSVQLRGSNTDKNVTLREGSLTIVNFVRSASGAYNGFQVLGSSKAATEDIYKYQRI